MDRICLIGALLQWAVFSLSKNCPDGLSRTSGDDGRFYFSGRFRRFRRYGRFLVTPLGDILFRCRKVALLSLVEKNKVFLLSVSRLKMTWVVTGRSQKKCNFLLALCANDLVNSVYISCLFSPALSPVLQNSHFVAATMLMLFSPSF